MERQGIVADRCELNRQIKVDNALLRELKSLVKKLMDAVKNTVPAIAEAMETARQKMIVFRYQLLHIGARKKHFSDTIQIVQPDIKRYEDIVKQLKSKIKECRGLLEEKMIPALQVFRHRELAQKIAGLTENIEELKSEKALLLNQFNCADDHGIDEIKQHIVSMESSLETLNHQEGKYTAELDAALAKYTELQQQAADMDAIELDAVRHVILVSRKIFLECKDLFASHILASPKYNPPSSASRMPPPLPKEALRSTNRSFDLQKAPLAKGLSAEG